METPVTLFRAWSAVLSPVFCNFFAEIPSTKLADFLFMVEIAASVFLACLAVMVKVSPSIA